MCSIPGIFLPIVRVTCFAMYRGERFKKELLSHAGPSAALFDRWCTLTVALSFPREGRLIRQRAFTFSPPTAPQSEERETWLTGTTPPFFLCCRTNRELGWPASHLACISGHSSDNVGTGPSISSCTVHYRLIGQLLHSGNCKTDNRCCSWART